MLDPPHTMGDGVDFDRPLANKKRILRKQGLGCLLATLSGVARREGGPHHGLGLGHYGNKFRQSSGLPQLSGVVELATAGPHRDNVDSKRHITFPFARELGGAVVARPSLRLGSKPIKAALGFREQLYF